MTRTSTPSFRRPAFILTLLAFALFLGIPAGPPRSPFSGIPFSSRGQLLVGLFGILIVGAAFFRPRQQPRLRWAAILLLLAVLKVIAASEIVPFGWQGRYWTAQFTHDPPQTFLRRVDFFNRRSQPYRIDEAVDFSRETFALHYVNDEPLENVVYKQFERDWKQPLLVVWKGFTEVPNARIVAGALTASGRVVIALDGQVIAAAKSPNHLPFRAALSAGRHAFTIRYTKPAEQIPEIHVVLPGLTFTPYPVPAARLPRSSLYAAVVFLLGLAALAVLGIAVWEGYRPLGRFALEDVWLHVDRLGAIAFFAYFILAGLAYEIPMRRLSISLGMGDDPFAYEGQARQILTYGLSMTDPYHTPAPYYFYPFYSYVLAGAHVLFGEDYATILLFNFVCMAVLGLIAWALLYRHLEPEGVVAFLFLFAVFTRLNVARYSGAAFSDNLYVPMTLLVVLVAVRAFERRSLLLLALTGVLTALGGATRPSLLILVPFMTLCAALFWPSARRITGRAVSAVIYAGGFIVGIAPFTIRNWIVAHKLVLVIGSYVMLPWFLYPPGEPMPTGWIIGNSGTMRDALRTAVKIFMSNPPHFFWGEVKKVLFTLGFQHFDPNAVMPRHLLFITLLFALAIWTGRIPRWTKIVILFVAASHLAAMVIASPYTYGYKTIIPFHLILGIGAAFLLPLRDRVVVRERQARAIATAPERRTVSVILPTYNEKDSIRQVIVDFFATGVADEVLVINNNAAPGTSEEVAGTGAREIFEPRQGYGAAIRRGLREAKGDYIVVCEPDGTFVPRDILKLLAYADDFDVVYGSRTSQQMVLKGANMGFFLRWGNWAVAKYLEFLYNATSLTDVGCTMRLIRREVAGELDGQFRIDGNQFGPEMMILTLRGGYRVVQVPVNYCERVGVSSVTGDPGKALLLGLQMIWLISARRFEDLFVRPAPGPAGAELDPSHGQ